MKLLLKIISIIILAALFSLFLLYLLLPTPSYPSNPPTSLESKERGDVEDYVNRRAYFTNLTREEVLAHHQKELNTIFPTYRLNYPPEDATIFIKELTRSRYLEEIVHPFRESFFVNGFIPQVAKDAINIEGQPFYQKVTVKYYRSDFITRITLGIVSLFLTLIILREWWYTLKNFGHA